MIPDLSDAAAPWWIEVRRESSCLGVGYTTAPFVARRFDGTVAITVRLDLIPALLSAIEELLAHPVVAAVDTVAGQSWSARREGDEGLLKGARSRPHDRCRRRGRWSCSHDRSRARPSPASPPRGRQPRAPGRRGPPTFTRCTTTSGSQGADQPPPRPWLPAMTGRRRLRDGVAHDIGDWTMNRSPAGRRLGRSAIWSMPYCSADGHGRHASDDPSWHRRLVARQWCRRQGAVRAGRRFRRGCAGSCCGRRERIRTGVSPSAW